MQDQDYILIQKIVRNGLKNFTGAIKTVIAQEDFQIQTDS